jgi:hypothetical protein
LPGGPFVLRDNEPRADAVGGGEILINEIVASPDGGLVEYGGGNRASAHEIGGVDGSVCGDQLGQRDHGRLRDAQEVGTEPAEPDHQQG